MLPEIGILCLIASLLASGALVLLGWCQPRVERALYYAFVQWGCGALAFLCLVACFLRDDFSVWYVRMNSSIALP